MLIYNQIKEIKEAGWPMPKHGKQILGSHSGGEIVDITLSGSSENVRLMDSSNFKSYRNIIVE